MERDVPEEMTPRNRDGVSAHPAAPAPEGNCGVSEEGENNGLPNGMSPYRQPFPVPEMNETSDENLNKRKDERI